MNTTEEFVERYKFRIHGECEATEFCSPVAFNLETIKALGRKLQRRVGKDRLLEPDQCEMAGIHVHTSTGANHRTTENMMAKVLMMLNRESSRDFVWNFSGRADAGQYEYRHQGRSTCWDSDGYEPGYDDWNDVELEPLEEAENNQMVRSNSFGDNSTIEYRIWNGVSDRLMLALEFSHACTKFIAQYDGSDTPYISEFKAWLFKQRGYKLLRATPEWSLVKGEN